MVNYGPIALPIAIGTVRIQIGKNGPIAHSVRATDS